MQVFHDAAEAGRALPGSVVTIGNFDGVHRGHRLLLARARAVGAAAGAPVLVVTFRPHPASVLSDAGAPGRLASDAQQRELFAAEGARGLLVQAFDTDFARLSAEEFHDRFLRAALGCRGVVVGSNFRFGAHRRGDVALLARLAAAREPGLEVAGVEPLVLDGDVVSSSRIRRLVEAGRVGDAGALLGRPFVVEGTVVRGDGRGRLIGFPTANVEPREVMLPGSGVYACALKRDEQVLAAVANVGRRPTFGTRPVGLEVHVLGFDGDLYGETVRVAFLDALRPERRFAGAEELVLQVRRDAEAARDSWERRPPGSLAGVPGF